MILILCSTVEDSSQIVIRSRMEIVHDTEPDQLGSLELPFDDSRLPEMLFRYRARNYPETLDANEKFSWDEYRHQHLLASNGEPGFTYEKI